MGFAQAYDNPRRERCLPEMSTTTDEPGYWLETVDMAEAFDQEMGQTVWDNIDFVVSMESYSKLRRAANDMLSKARTPRQVYAVIEKLPPDFFEIEDEVITSHTWIDGQPLLSGFYTIESRAESMLKGFRFVQRKQSTTVRVLAPDETPIAPVLAKKGGNILRAQTREQLRLLIDAGYKVYVQEVGA